MTSLLNLTKKEYSLIFLLFLAETTRSAFFLTFWPLYAVGFLKTSLVSAGMVVSASYLTETIFKTFAGSQLDRYGRPVLLIGLMVCLASFVSIYFAANQWLIILMAAIFGLGYAPLWLAVMSNVAPVERPDRAGRMGLVFTAWLLGTGTGTVGINFILPIGYHQTFILLISLMALCLLLGLLIPITAKTSSIKVSIVEQLKRLAKDQMVVKILLPGMFLQTLAASLLLPILPVYATQLLGLSSEQYGLLLMVGGAATVICLIPMGKLVDRLPLKNILTAGFLLSSCFLALLPLATNIISVFMLVALVGIAYAIILPAWNALLARAIPTEHQATGWGIFTSLEGLGTAAGPVLGGMAANWIHPAGAIYFSSLILGAMACFYLLYPLERIFTDREWSNVS